MREIWFAALVGLTLAWVHPAAAQPAKPDGNAASVLAPTKEDRVLGKPGAPITIVEYASLSCPHCAHFSAEVLPELKKSWIDTGKAELIMRDFPLDQAALRAAMVARCAPPDRFYPFVETLFATQDKWVLAKDWQAALERIALLGGISKKEVDSCLANETIKDQVAQSRLTAAMQLGVDSTPTFFIDGKKYEGDLSFEALDKLLSGLVQKS